MKQSYLTFLAKYGISLSDTPIASAQRQAAEDGKRRLLTAERYQIPLCLESIVEQRTTSARVY